VGPGSAQEYLNQKQCLALDGCNFNIGHQAGSNRVGNQVAQAFFSIQRITNTKWFSGTVIKADENTPPAVLANALTVFTMF